MQEGSSPVVGLRPAGFLMSKKPPVRVSGVDHIKVAPDERSVWWCERKLGILALRMNVGMAVPSMKFVINASDSKSNEAEKRKKHVEEHSAGQESFSVPFLNMILVKLIKRVSLSMRN